MLKKITLVLALFSTGAHARDTSLDSRCEHTFGQAADELSASFQKAIAGASLWTRFNAKRKFKAAKAALTAELHAELAKQCAADAAGCHPDQARRVILNFLAKAGVSTEKLAHGRRDEIKRLTIGLAILALSGVATTAFQLLVLDHLKVHFPILMAGADKTIAAMVNVITALGSMVSVQLIQSRLAAKQNELVNRSTSSADDISPHPDKEAEALLINSSYRAGAWDARALGPRGAWWMFIIGETGSLQNGVKLITQGEQNIGLWQIATALFNMRRLIVEIDPKVYIALDQIAPPLIPIARRYGQRFDDALMARIQWLHGRAHDGEAIPAVEITNYYEPLLNNLLRPKFLEPAMPVLDEDEERTLLLPVTGAPSAIDFVEPEAA